MENVICIILGGGKGTRLHPLTEERSKPAVPFGGKFRLVDIPISNCINSNFRQIYVLTQFNSASLHNHIAHTYQFDTFNRGFVEVLAAEQRPHSESWYQGTADAVRKNLVHFRDQNPDYYIILSGDQLYRMNLKEFLDEHISNNAEVSIAAKPVCRTEATGLGIIQSDEHGRAKDFIEKPSPDLDINYLKTPNLTPGEEFLASMGIYIFNAKTMNEVLDNDFIDFGKDIIPDTIKERSVHTYIFNQYWEDIGTIKSFYECNLNLASLIPKFNFYDNRRPIYTHRRDLPPTKINQCTVQSSVICEGGIIDYATVLESLVGIRAILGRGVLLQGVYFMGASFYETDIDRSENIAADQPNIGVGVNTKIYHAIIDTNARIGANCSIGDPKIDREDGHYEHYSVVDGIVIIKKNAIIQDNTVI